MDSDFESVATLEELRRQEVGPRRLERRAHPFGYRVNRETGFLEVEPGEAELVPLIFDLYANKRMGSRAIAGW